MKNFILKHNVSLKQAKCVGSLAVVIFVALAGLFGYLLADGDAVLAAFGAISSVAFAVIFAFFIASCVAGIGDSAVATAFGVAFLVAIVGMFLAYYAVAITFEFYGVATNAVVVASSGIVALIAARAGAIAISVSVVAVAAFVFAVTATFVAVGAIAAVYVFNCSVSVVYVMSTIIAYCKSVEGYYKINFLS